MRIPSWPLLVAAVLVAPWIQFQTIIPITAWILPVLLLRVARTTPRFRFAWVAIVLVYTVGIVIALRNGVAPVPGWVVVGMGVVTGLVRSIPYGLDRWIGPRFSPIWRTLVFPAAMTAVEWLAIRWSPFGSWGMTGYSQSGSLALIQVVSLTGLSGLSFLIHWAAPVVNAAWEAPGLRASWRPAAVFTACFLLIVGYGFLRINLDEEPERSVLVAAVVPSVPQYDSAFAGPPISRIARAGDPERDQARARFQPLIEGLLRASDLAAQAGARVIAWPEYIPVLAEDEPELTRRAGELSRARGAVVLVNPIVVRRSERFPYLENINLLVQPSGEVGWRYPKTYPVLGLENTTTAGGPGQVPLWDAPWGRVSAVICQDMDFPWLVRQAGQNGVDVLVAPADDWRVIRRVHAIMAMYRAIENGVSVLRPANNGISVAVDPYGRLRGIQVAGRASQGALLASLPARQVPTLYARAGDWFAWLSVALTTLFVAFGAAPTTGKSR